MRAPCECFGGPMDVSPVGLGSFEPSALERSDVPDSGVQQFDELLAGGAGSAAPAPAAPAPQPAAPQPPPPPLPPSQPAAPQPAAPQPIAPQPIAPQPIAPQPAASTVTSTN